MNQPVHITAHQQWRAAAQSVEQLFGQFDRVWRERERAAAEAVSWKEAFDAADRRAQDAEQERDQLQKQLAAVVEVLQFLRISHEGGLTRLSPAVEAMVTAATTRLPARGKIGVLSPSLSGQAV